MQPAAFNAVMVSIAFVVGVICGFLGLKALQKMRQERDMRNSIENYTSEDPPLEGDAFNEDCLESHSFF